MFWLFTRFINIKHLWNKFIAEFCIFCHSQNSWFLYLSKNTFIRRPRSMSLYKINFTCIHNAGSCLTEEIHFPHHVLWPSTPLTDLSASSWAIRFHPSTNSSLNQSITLYIQVQKLNKWLNAILLFTILLTFLYFYNQFCPSVQPYYINISRNHCAISVYGQISMGTPSDTGRRVAGFSSDTRKVLLAARRAWYNLYQIVRYPVCLKFSIYFYTMQTY